MEGLDFQRADLLLAQVGRKIGENELQRSATP